MIKKFVKEFNLIIANGLKSGYFKEDYFTTWNYHKNSETHSRMQGAIAGICVRMGFNVEIERSFTFEDNGEKIKFRPDISIYKGDKLEAFIEYESTNSSDERFYSMGYENTSDLRCLKKYGLAGQNVPPYWIVISTLPKKNVEYSDWNSWYPSRSKNKKYNKIIESPYDYFMPIYIKETEKVMYNGKIKTKFYLLNIDSGEVGLVKFFR